MEATIDDILQIVAEIDPSLRVGARIGPGGPYLTFVGRTPTGRPVMFEIGLLHADGRSLAWWRAAIDMKWRYFSGRRWG